jgi:hypothetical protein
MNRKSLLSVFAAAGLLMFCSIGSANNKSAEVRTLTGCLSAGDTGHEYLLKTSEGATWDGQTFDSCRSYRDRNR